MNENPSNMNEDDLQGAWRTAGLIGKFLRKELSVDEEDELYDWINSSKKNRLLFEELTNEKNLANAKKWFAELEQGKDKSLAELKEKISFNPVRRPYFKLRWLAVAAVVGLLIAGAGIFFNGRSKGNRHSGEMVVKAGDVAPGGNKATLQLSDGSLIALNDQQKGVLKKESGTTITKTSDGEILYDIKSEAAENIPFNTLTTPLGGQYVVTLPDGSRAWLNASSSLRYPISFSKGRTVEMTGEVYFEVKKDQSPFVVMAKGTRIEVLGTHFNVNSYNKVQTTLLEGSVKLNNDKILQPGERAISDKDVQIEKLEYPQDIVAWKDGFFQFNNENINDIMDQLGRWYSIDVSFEGKLDQTRFTATALRTDNLSSILQSIETAGHIHFKIEGDKIKVMP